MSQYSYDYHILVEDAEVFSFLSSGPLTRYHRAAARDINNHLKQAGIDPSKVKDSSEAGTWSLEFTATGDGSLVLSEGDLFQTTDPSDGDLGTAGLVLALDEDLTVAVSDTGSVNATAVHFGEFFLEEGATLYPKDTAPINFSSVVLKDHAESSDDEDLSLGVDHQLTQLATYRVLWRIYLDSARTEESEYHFKAKEYKELFREQLGLIKAGGFELSSMTALGRGLSVDRSHGKVRLIRG